ncbi:MAG: DUF3080 family protein [Motiliproteus sp.]
MRHLARLMAPMILLIVSGCEDNSADAVLSDYVARVSNTLEQDTDNDDPYQNLVAFPPRRERHIAITELRAGLMEALSLSSCELLPLIAERNSSLGKVMKPSTLLRYELRFFERLESCYRRYQNSTSENPGFLHLLTETYQLKSANLENSLWNGIFTSEAIEGNFSLSKGPIPLAGNPGFGASLRALKFFNNLVDSTIQYRNGDPFLLPNTLPKIERHYFALHRSEYGSQLIKSLALLTYHLEKTASALNKAQLRRPLCFSGKPTEKAKILNNILIKYYAGKVQPYMSRVQRNGQAWLKQTNLLVNNERLPVPAAMQKYHAAVLDMKNPDAPWSRYQQAIKTHTHAWQTILQQCGLMPEN